MSEGADSITQTCGNSLTTLEDESGRDAATAAATPTSPPPSTYTGRRPRFGTGSTPPSPYVWVDGRQLRSALAWTKKWPPRRVSFPTSDSHLVTGYLEPANPWRHAENVSREDLIFAYKESCARHSTEPLKNILLQLENLEISEDRCAELNLKGEMLDQDHSEPLEEILKRVQFNKINLEETSLNEESSIILFDMLEYYESTKYLNISCNPEIGARGWQACSHMIKKTQCLEQLEAKDIMFNEQYMNILSRALRLVCHLHVLKLENCGLSGRAVVILVTALKMNSGIRELYLADNGLDLYDAIQLGSLLRMNNHLQLLDISNNNVQDDGVRDILEGLINQVNEDKTGKGLSILILWNNRLTKKSSPYFSRIIALSKTLETLNIGQNMLTDETLSIVNESLKNNRVLLQLGMQSTELTCEGIITLTEIMEANQVLQRIDLRDNSIKMAGMHALVSVVKKNKSITQIDLDDKPRIKIDAPLHQYMELVAEIRSCCSQNGNRRLLEEFNEDIESPQHPSRPFNASSRKISLTCQTLPSPSRPAASLVADEPARTMLEPKRTSGGRLRSPAPSPIPSPVASPIPSPSRNRFVVSRVPEASLRSADSSASSSPVTPPSLGSSPTCCFPGTSGSSRFRVSIVESVDASRSSLRPVVASSNSNITIGFNFKVDAIESADSDDYRATKADTMIQNVSDNAATSIDTLNAATSVDTFNAATSVDILNAAASVDTLNIAPVMRGICCNTVESSEDCCDEETKSEQVQLSEQEMKTQLGKYENIITAYEGDCNKLTEIDETQLVQNTEVQSGKNELVTTICENYRDNSNVIMRLENDVKTDRDTEMIGDHRNTYISTKELQVPAYPNEDTATMKISVSEDRILNCATKSSLDVITESAINPPELSSICLSKSSASTTLKTSSIPRRVDMHPQEKMNMSMQRHKSNLEKLLSLFQHPGQFFLDSPCADPDTKNSLQENVSGVMTLGDRLQQYLKEGRAKVNIDNSWSSEHASPLKNKSVKLNVSQLQNLTSIFRSFKLEPQASLVEHDTKLFHQARNQDPTSREEEDLERSTETESARNEGKNLFCQEKSRITGNDDNDLVIEKGSQVANDDEDILVDQEKNRIMKNHEKKLLHQEKYQIAEDDENNLFDQEKDLEITNNKEDLNDKRKNQVFLNDENLFEAKTQSPRIDEKNFQENQEKQLAEDNEQDLKNQEQKIVKNNEDLENPKQDSIMRNNEKDCINTQDSHIDTREDACNISELQSVQSDQSDLPLSESVQLKDDFSNEDLVLDDDYVATNAAVLSSLANVSTVSVAIELTDIPEYSVLELSQADGLGYNDTAHLECDLAKNSQRSERSNCNDQDEQECNDAKSLEHLKYDDTKRLKHNGSKRLECDNTKCLKCDSIDEEAIVIMGRTCDRITTDSINQTSDSSFPICNIIRDRRIVDSVSIASVSTSVVANDVSTTLASKPDNGDISPMSLGDVKTLLASLQDVDANDHLDDEVTNSTRCIADKKCSSDSAMKGNSAEILDDACRDTTHHRSTSIDIKIGEHILETNPASRSQDSPERLHERQLSMPNNVDVHRTILKDVAEVDRMENTVDDGKRIDPAIFVTPYETSANLDKSDAEDLIFCITDIFMDGASVDDESSPSITSKSSSNDIAKAADSYFELSTTMPAATLLIENSEDVYRNSQDSGIEETVLVIDDSVTVDAHPLPPPRGSLQESVDSGIESECSSISVKVESTAERILEAAPISKKSFRDDNVCERNDGNVGSDDGNDDDYFGEFASNFLTKEGRLIDNDNVTGIAHSYLGSIKCAVVNPARPVVEITSSAPLEVVIAEEGIARSAIIAHTPAAVHDASPK